MAKCQNCHHGINSTYIREEVRGSFKKIGYYCNICNIHYDIGKRPYTVNEELYTVSNMHGNTSILPQKLNMLSNDHDYSSIYNKINENMRDIYMGRVGFGPTTPATSRRYLNQARPPAPFIFIFVLKDLYIKFVIISLIFLTMFESAVIYIANRQQCHYQAFLFH
jgi:hypothetical protein